MTQRHHGTKSLTLACIAIGIVTLIFFDVIFLKTSLQPSNIDPQIFQPANWKTHSTFVQANPYTRPAYGFVDLGATAWQSEPARYLMARNFREHESPYWNPYSAGGTIGPETLVDIKFSPFTLLSAYFFNASPESFDYGLIITYIIGAYIILLIFNQYFDFSLAASIAGAILYLLNGFSIANLNSHMGQPYFLFPLLLYSLVMFTRKQTLPRWVFVALTHALMLSITFLPTLLLVLFSAHSINLVCYTQKNTSVKKLFQYISWVLLASIMGLLLIAFLWFPIIDSLFVTDMFAKFQDRSVQATHSFENLLSVFTPKHFWETTAPMLHSTVYPNANLENNGELLITYTGVFPAIIASYALSKNLLENRKIVLLAFMLLIFSYARIFGLTGFIDHIPIVSNIGTQYFGCLTAIALIFLVAQGIENIRNNQITHVPAMIILAVMAVAFLNLYHRLGWVDLVPYRKYLIIFLYHMLLGSITVLLLYKSKMPKAEIANLMIILAVFELMFYMNTVRPMRYNPVEQQPAFVSFLKNNIDNSRVMNIGEYRTLYPEYGAMYGIKQLDTQNPAHLPWYRDFYTRHFGSDSWSFLTIGYAAEYGEVVLPEKIIDETALDIANVKYVLVLDKAKKYFDFFQHKNYPVVFQHDGLSIFENVNHLAAATLVPALIQSSEIPETPDFNPALAATTHDSILLAQARQLGIPVLPGPDHTIKPLPATAVITSSHNTEIILHTESGQASVLALSEVWHPNWKATVDGQPVYIGRINEAFRGIALPAGSHNIRMYYESTALRYGIYTSGISLAILLCVLAWTLIRSPRMTFLR